MNILYKLTEKLKYLTTPYDGDESVGLSEKPSDEAASGREPIVCPGCGTPLEVILWPRCPHCGKELKDLFPPTPTFGLFKKELLDNMTYGEAVEKKRKAAGGGLPETFVFALFCAANLWCAVYLIEHMTAFRSVEDRYG